METAVKSRSSYVAQIGQNDVQRLAELDHFAEVMTEDVINNHVIVGHLAWGRFVEDLGFLYDAELAAFLGLSLQKTADTTQEVIDAVRNGNFGEALAQSLVGSTQTFKIMNKGHDGSLEETISKLEIEHNYSGRLAAELQTLSRLGVASVDPVATQFSPAAEDSFFRDFNVVLL